MAQAEGTVRSEVRRAKRGHAQVMAEAEGTVGALLRPSSSNPAHRPDMTMGIPEGIPIVMAEAEGFEPSMGL
jgi:hypothetical protein